MNNSLIEIDKILLILSEYNEILVDNVNHYEGGITRIRGTSPKCAFVIEHSLNEDFCSIRFISITNQAETIIKVANTDILKVLL